MKRVLFVFFVLCVAAIEDALGKCDPNTQCSKLTNSFATWSKNCCKKQLKGDAFVASELTKSCKATPENWKWANSYQISSLQDIYYYNYVDITQPAVSESLCRNGEFMECIFKANKLINTNANVDPEALKTYLMLNLKPDAQWTSIFDKSIIDLSTNDIYYFAQIHLNDRYMKIPCPGNKTISLKPLMMMQMIQSKIIQLCPERHPVRNKNLCDKLTADFKFCDGEKISSPTGQGVFYYE